MLGLKCTHNDNDNHSYGHTHTCIWWASHVLIVAICRITVHCGMQKIHGCTLTESLPPSRWRTPPWPARPLIRAKALRN